MIDRRDRFKIYIIVWKHYHTEKELQKVLALKYTLLYGNYSLFPITATFGVPL